MQIPLSDLLPLIHASEFLTGKLTESAGASLSIPSYAPSDEVLDAAFNAVQLRMGQAMTAMQERPEAVLPAQAVLKECHQDLYAIRLLQRYAKTPDEDGFTGVQDSLAHGIRFVADLLGGMPKSRKSGS